MLVGSVVAATAMTWPLDDQLRRDRFRQLLRRAQLDGSYLALGSAKLRCNRIQV
jgi:hypothetical protein